MDEKEVSNSRKFDFDLEIRNKMFQVIAQLLVLLIWGARREGSTDLLESNRLHDQLRDAEKKIEELKRIRCEDAKANEKVVAIFAEQEQSWLIERKCLRQQIGVVSELNAKLKEKELLLESKDKILEQYLQQTQELKENSKSETQEHAFELRRVKNALIELVSNQRQLEVEMTCALRQVEASKKELDSVLEQKEGSVLLVEKLSAENVKLSKELDQKDKILSAMLRKSRLDRAEKQALLKEIKFLKAKTKSGSFSPISDCFSLEDNEEFGRTDDTKQMGGLIHLKAEKYRRMIEQRHNREIEAFADEMRIKDKKLESYHWHMLSMEFETKRLQSQVSGLNQNMLRLQHENLKLKALSLERGEEEITKPASVDMLPLRAVQLSRKRNVSWRMDLHALAVSYKIKRLKQQLLMLEKFSEKQKNGHGKIEINSKTAADMKEFHLLMRSWNKQVTRYQRVQEKADDLCRRMKENGDVDVLCEYSAHKEKGKGEMKTVLESFLKETFQLQRYVVATGQKLIEVRSKIDHSFPEFADNIENLFWEVQTGLETRIVRVIGDLEGTLACECIINNHQKMR